MAFGSSSSKPRNNNQEVLDRLNELTRRVRDVEGNKKTIETKLSSLEDRIIRKQEKKKKDIDKLKETMEEIQTKLMRFDNEIEKLKRRVNESAQQTDLEKIENYIDLLSPMKTEYITKNEAKRLIKKEINNIND